MGSEEKFSGTASSKEKRAEAQTRSIPLPVSLEKASCSFGRHVKMPAFNEPTNDAEDAGFLEINSIQLGSCFLMFFKHNITLSFCFLFISLC